jgi:hypothetical protein
MDVVPPPPPPGSIPSRAPAGSRVLTQTWASGPGSGSSRPRRSGRRPPRNVVAAGLAILLVASGAYVFTRPRKAAPPAPPAKVLVELSLVKGASFRFRFDATLTAEMHAGTATVQVVDQIRGIMVWHVRSVDSEGVAHVTAIATNVTNTTNGHKVRQPTQTFHLRIASDGRVLAAAGLGTTSGKGNTGPGIPGIDQMVPLLPGLAVAPGSSWSKSFDQANPFGAGAVHYATSSSLLRFEQVGLVRAAVIQSTANLPINVSINERKALAATGQPATGLAKGTSPVYRFTGQAEFDQIAWIDPTHKSLIKSTTTEHLALAIRATGLPRADQPPGGTVNMTGTVTLSLQSA